MIIVLLLLFAIGVNISKRKKHRKKHTSVKRLTTTQHASYDKMKRACIQQQKQQERERVRIMKEQEKKEREAEKAREAEEKQRRKRQQAEADIMFLQNQSDLLMELIIANDEAIENLEKQIEIDKALRAYDSENRHSKHKEQLINKRITLENKLHTLERKIVAANYIITA